VAKIEIGKTEWPKWANFRYLGDSLYTLGSFGKITEGANILGYFFLV
jgi:hypothetical protein